LSAFEQILHEYVCPFSVKFLPICTDDVEWNM
jgi:hypothetical protein